MSIQLFLADKLIRLTVKRRFAKEPDIMTLRAIMEGAPEARVPAQTKIEAMTLGGVPTERLAAPGSHDDRAILYIHGGGFVGGSPRTHRTLTAPLSGKSQVPVYAIDYRLAPEHPFPAGLEDCVTAYRALLALGLPSSCIAVGGDSAGGNLTLALAHKLKALSLPLPSSLFCISPVTDFTAETDSRRANPRKDAMFVPAMFDTVIDRYCPNCDPSDPLISPLKGDVSGFPPTLIQCSADEMLRDDGILMAAKLKAAAIQVELEVWPKVFHAWPVVADWIPESRKATDNIVAFVTRHLPGNAGA
jgi:acetyl esterase/lipase